VKPVRIGIDLGGTKIEALAMDEAGNLFGRERRPTPQGDYAATLDTICELVAKLQQSYDCQSIGIATPGSLSAVTGRMKNCNSTCLNGQALADDLQQRLSLPLRLANDANCFALSEAIDGAAQDADSVFGVILRTGVGGGFVWNKQALIGDNGLAGEWGHNPMSGVAARAARACYCGRENCIETWLSGPGLQQSFFERSGRQLNVQDIVALAEQGDNNAVEQLAQYAVDLARALAQVVNILDPDYIVLGGGLSNLHFLYEVLPEKLSASVFGPDYHGRIVAPEFGDSSGIRGAARLWPLS
jgi:predicted NBD/HSP70 family sugar kinase